MSSDDVILATLSSSSSSDLNSLKHAASHSTPTPNPDTEEEPDWVRDHNPRKSTDQDKRDALLASLSFAAGGGDEDDDDDDESIIDLLSPETRDGQTRVAQRPGSQSDDARGDKDKAQASGAGARRMKGAKPRNRLPLVVAPRLDESLVLLQSEGAELDLSGDVGAVGRVKVEGGELYMDLKGVLYRGVVGECNSMCVVNVGEDEARVTSVLDEVVTLRRERDLFASGEIVLRGELEGECGDEEGRAEGEGERGSERGKKRRKGGDDGGRGRGRGRGKGGGDAANADGKRAVRRRKQQKNADSTQ